MTIQLDEQLRRYEDLARRAKDLRSFSRPTDELDRIEARVAAPDFWKDQEAAQKLLQRRRRLEEDRDLSESLAGRRPC